MDDNEGTLLSLDMSTTATGWSLHGIESKELLKMGLIKPSTKGGIAKMTYPRQQLTKMLDIANQILHLIMQLGPQCIVIEEIAGSKNRMGQKTLDGLHFIVVWVIEDYLHLVSYQDVTGSRGWRPGLGLRLSDADKLANKEARILNKKLSRNQQIPIIGPKHLAARYVNRKFNLDLNVDLRGSDADLADAIAMGDYFINNMIK